LLITKILPKMAPLGSTSVYMSLYREGNLKFFLSLTDNQNTKHPLDIVKCAHKMKSTKIWHPLRGA